MSTQPLSTPTEKPAASPALKSVKTAFTGQTMIFTSDEAAEYERLSKIRVDHYKPVSFDEELLVQSIIDVEWRIRRIASLEQGIYALGARELAESTPAYLLPAAVYLKYQHQFKDLSTQESRLHRYLDADLKKLEALQRARFESEMLRRKMEEARAKATAAATTTATPTSSCRLRAHISTHSPNHR